MIDPPDQNSRDDLGDLEDLSKSIGSVGLLEPVVVRPQRKRFQLVAGERRLKACQLLDWTEIPATVRKLTDREAAQIRLLENIDRRSLNPIEEAGNVIALSRPDGCSVTLEPGEYVFSCPLNTTPDYKLVVKGG